MRESVVHAKGPFVGLFPGDTIRVIYHGAPTALMVISRVKNFALEGKDGDFKCKITAVGEKELRFYGDLPGNRQTVLRDIQIVKVVERTAPPNVL